MPVESLKLMDQPTFSDLEYQDKKRKTRRELFLERMEATRPGGSSPLESPLCGRPRSFCS